MTKPTPRLNPVTPIQWLAVALIWGLATYGAMTGEPATHPQIETTTRLIACR